MQKMTMFGLRSIFKCSFYSKVFVSSRSQSQVLKYFPRVNISGNQNIQNVFARKSQCRYISRLENENVSFKVPNIDFSYISNENIFCLNVLKSIDDYKQYFPSLELCNLLSVLPETYEVNELSKENLSKQSGVELANMFLKYSTKPKYEYMLSNNHYQHLFEALTLSLKDIPDPLLIEVTKAIAMWQSCIKKYSFRSKPPISCMWDSALKEMAKRDVYLSTKSKLILSLMPFVCSVPRTNFFFFIVNSLGSDIANLNSHELVMFMFVLNTVRRLPRDIVTWQLEKKLFNAVNELSIQEVGILMLGLFKTETFINDRSLTHTIVLKTMDNLEGIQDITLVSILKYIKKVVDHSYEVLIVSLLDELSKVMPSLNHVTLTYIGLIGRDCRVFRPELLNYIAERIEENLSEVRLKEIDRIMLTLSTFNFLPNNSHVFFEKVVKELERRNLENYFKHIEHLKDAIHIGSVVVFLAIFEVYSLPLIALLLDQNYVRGIISLKKPPRIAMGIYNNLLLLNTAMNLDKSINYTGMKISIPDQVTLRQIQETRRLYFCGRRLEAYHYVRNTMIQYFGCEKFIADVCILPEDSEINLVFCTDTNGKIVAIPDSYYADQKKLPREPPRSYKGTSLLWNVVFIVNRTGYCTNNLRFRGLIAMKIRQMKRLGYNVTHFPDILSGDILQELAKTSTLKLN